MKDIALLDYCFMLDPTETYTNVFQLEADLAQFFASKGMEAKVIKTIEGASGRRVLMIQKKEEAPMSTETKESKEKTILQQKAQLTSSRGFDGRWR